MKATGMLFLGAWLLACTSSVCAQPQPGSPWPMLRRDQYHTGRSPYNGPEASALRWLFETGAHNRSSPAVSADGTVYLSAYDGYVYAINPDGTEKWRFDRSAGGGGESSPSIGADGTIYVGSLSPFLYAINPDGTEKWTFEVGGNAIASPTIGQDGRIYIGNFGTGTLYALNPDGSVEWAYSVGNLRWVYDAPCIGPDGTIYVQINDGYLYALSPAGSLLWKYYIRFSGGGYRASTSFSVADSTVYTGSVWDTLYALTPDGALKWTFGTEEDVCAAPVIGDDGVIYFGSDDFYALYPDGTLKWCFREPGRIAASAAIDSDGTVYFGTVGTDTSEPHVYALNPDGSLLWQYEVSGRVLSCPAIGSDGTMYIAPEDGNLYAFGGTTGAEERGHLRVFRYELRQNSPNPFVASGRVTSIQYGLASRGHASLKVYDVTGRTVRTLVQEEKKAGLYRVEWDGKDLRGKDVGSGVYFYSLHAGSFADTKKMILFR
jgi:outer membrane protein assembly factor BamB